MAGPRLEEQTIEKEGNRNGEFVLDDGALAAAELASL